MFGNIVYCSAFREDKFYGAIIDAFLFKWTSPCIANPKRKPKDMIKTVMYALASSECY